MFEVGFTEIVLIFGIALLVLGPTRLPKLAADLGRWAGRARAMARQLRTQLEQEVQFDPLQEPTAAARPSSSTATHVAPTTAGGVAAATTVASPNLAEPPAAGDAQPHRPDESDEPRPQ